MRSAFALRINSGKNILYFVIPERLRTLRYDIFTGGGRGGKRHLQRRFLRKRGAARHLPLVGGRQPSQAKPIGFASSPEGGAYCCLTVSSLKPPPFGGGGIAQR